MSADIIDVIIQMYTEGASVQEIASESGLTEDEVTTILEDNNVL